jgi:pimeloyl-ACP methyl ester carboxylesterase
MRRVLWTMTTLLVIVVALPFIGDALFDWGPGDELLPQPGRQVNIGESRTLAVREYGQGKAVVLVHGWASCADDWQTVPKRLAALGHRVIVYDRPGYGHSTRLDASHGNYTYASNARDLTALLDAIHVERATFVGWSFGGGVVQTLATSSPERVEALVLLSSSGPGQADDEGDGLGLVDLALASPLGVAILSWVTKTPPLSYKTTHDSVSVAFSGAANVPKGWTIRTQAMLALPGTIRSVVSEARGGDVASLRPEEIAAPTLVIHGTEDRLVSYAVAEDLHERLPTSALEPVIGGSHMLPATHPDLLARKISELVGDEYREARLPGIE